MRLTVIAVTVAAGLAALPAAASAADFCVGAKPAGVTCDTPSGDTPSKQLEAALAAPDERNNGARRIFVADGTYTGEFRYAGEQGVEVVGRGPATILEAKGAHPAFDAPSFVRLSDLTLRTRTQNPGQPVLRFQVGGSAERVALEGAADGIALDDQSAVGDAVALSGIAVTGSRVGIQTTGTVVLSDSRVRARDVALDAAPGATVRVQRSVLETTGSESIVYALRNQAADVSVAGSVLRSVTTTAESAAVATDCAGDVATTEIRTSTIAAKGPTGVLSICMTGAGTSATTFVDASVLAPGTRPEAVGNDASVGLAASRWDGDAPTPGVVVFAETGMRTEDPRFVGTDDLRLRADSPLVDTLPADRFSAGDGFGDVDGQARPLDGNGDGTAGPDYGAFETVPPPGPDTAGNLLRNGGAEEGDAPALPGWTGPATVVPVFYGDSSLLPRRTFATTFGGGRRLFGANGTAQLRQTTDLRAREAAIDGPGSVATLSGLLGAAYRKGPEEVVTVTATFRDAAGAPLGSPLVVGPVTSTELGFVSGLARRTATAAVPKGARSVETVVAFDDADASGVADGFADELSLTLADNPAPVDPGGGGAGSGGGGGSGGGAGSGGAGGGAGGGATPPPAYVGPALTGGRLRLDAKGRVAVPVSCPATAVGGCVGTLELIRPAAKASAAARRKKRAVRLARAKVSVAAGAKRTVRLKLSRKARRGLRKSTKLTLRLVTRDARPGARAVTKSVSVRLVRPR